MKRLDFTNPELIKSAASFPHYGQAMALIRAADPYWKVDPAVDHDWIVRFNINPHGCDCEYCGDVKRVSVAARTPQEAELLAFAELSERDRPHADCDDIRLADKLGVDFPAWAYEIGGAA